MITGRGEDNGTPGNGSLTFSWGSSANTVFTPTRTASCRARKECSSLNDNFDEMSKRVLADGAL